MIEDVFLDEDMEAPCLCDCGEWFDLNDGYRTEKIGSNKIVCPDCHQNEMVVVKEIEKLEEEIYQLEFEGRKHARVTKLKQQVEKLKEDL